MSMYMTVNITFMMIPTKCDYTNSFAVYWFICAYYPPSYKFVDFLKACDVSSIALILDLVYCKLYKVLKLNKKNRERIAILMYL